MCYAIKRAMPDLLSACGFHVGYSHSRPLMRDDPLVQAIALLERVYKENIMYANELHDPTIFEIPASLFETHAKHWGIPEPIDMHAPSGMDAS